MIVNSAAELQRILSTCHRIALVGSTHDPTKPAHGIFRYLMGAGYDMVPVNPDADEVFGLPCVASVGDVTPTPDIVNVFRRPHALPSIVDDAIAVGAPV